MGIWKLLTSIQPGWARRMELRIMSTLQELTDLLSDIGTEVGKVSADTDNLLTQLANIPQAGMTPEQQAQLDAAVASATAIRDQLKSLDEKVPD